MLLWRLRLGKRAHRPGCVVTCGRGTEPNPVPAHSKMVIVIHSFAADGGSGRFHFWRGVVRVRKELEWLLGVRLEAEGGVCLLP